MESLILVIVGIGWALIRYYTKQQQAMEDQARKKNNQTVSRPRPSVPPMQANRSLVSMKSGKPQQPTKIEKRRVEQQSAADKSRIHQSLHEKEMVEEKQKEWAKQIEAAGGPARFEFEDSDLMAEVADLMVCGYPNKKSGQRDFIAEGVDFLNRISSSEIEVNY